MYRTTMKTRRHKKIWKLFLYFKLKFLRTIKGPKNTKVKEIKKISSLASIFVSACNITRNSCISCAVRRSHCKIWKMFPSICTLSPTFSRVFSSTTWQIIMRFYLLSRNMPVSLSVMNKKMKETNKKPFMLR